MVPSDIHVVHILKLYETGQSPKILDAPPRCDPDWDEAPKPLVLGSGISSVLNNNVRSKQNRPTDIILKYPAKSSLCRTTADKRTHITPAVN